MCVADLHLTIVQHTHTRTHTLTDRHTRERQQQPATRASVFRESCSCSCAAAAAAAAVQQSLPFARLPAPSPSLFRCLHACESTKLLSPPPLLLLLLTRLRSSPSSSQQSVCPELERHTRCGGRVQGRRLRIFRIQRSSRLLIDSSNMDEGSRRQSCRSFAPASVLIHRHVDDRPTIFASCFHSHHR